MMTAYRACDVTAPRPCIASPPCTCKYGHTAPHSTTNPRFACRCYPSWFVRPLHPPPHLIRIQTSNQPPSAVVSPAARAYRTPALDYLKQSEGPTSYAFLSRPSNVVTVPSHSLKSNSSRVSIEKWL